MGLPTTAIVLKREDCMEDEDDMAEIKSHFKVLWQQHVSKSTQDTWAQWQGMAYATSHSRTPAY